MWLVLDQLQKQIIGVAANTVERECLQLWKVELQLACGVAEALEVAFEPSDTTIYYVPASSTQRTHGKST